MNSIPIERRASELHVAVACAALLTLVAIAWFIFSYGYIEDDAFIHLEFARSLSEGIGFAFNGHVVNGDTAPLWALVLAGIHWLGVDWLVSAKVACGVGAVTAVSGAWRLGRDLAADRPELQFLPVAVPVVTVVSPYFAHWSFSGMETLTALGVSFWAISSGLLGPASRPRFSFAAFLLGIGPLLRPELILLTAIAGPLLLLRIRSTGAREKFGGWVSLAVPALIMLLPTVLWSLYALHAFGAIVPNTNLAKQGGSLRELAPRLLSVYTLGFPVTLMLLPFIAVPRRIRGVPPVVWVLLLWPAACVCFYLANHTLVQTRYCLLSMPSLSIAVLWLIADGRRARLFAGTVAAMVAAGSLTISLIVVPHVINKIKYVDALAQISTHLREHIPANAPVAVYAIGEVAFESHHPLVDTGGITDSSVVPHINNPVETLAWAKTRGARYYIAGKPPEPGSESVFDTNVPYIGWTLKRSMYGTQETLSVYRLPLPPP